MIYVVIALMIATLGVMISGVVLMGGGGKLNAKYSNRLMTARVALQALTIAAFCIMVAVR